VKVKASDFGSAEDLVMDEIERVDIKKQVHLLFSDLKGKRRLPDVLRRPSAIAEFLGCLPECGRTSVSGFGRREHTHDSMLRFG
jgi:hypothetical protein